MKALKIWVSELKGLASPKIRGEAFFRTKYTPDGILTSFFYGTFFFIFYGSILDSFIQTRVELPNKALDSYELELERNKEKEKKT